jgi:hypothetical protein
MLVVRTCFWLCLTMMFEATLRVLCPTVKTSIFHPTSSITLAKSTHACFSSTHIYTIGASFFYRYFRAPKNIKRASRTKLYMYLKLKNSLQCYASSKLSKHALQKIAQTLSIENKLSNHEPICMDSTILHWWHMLA